MRDLSSDILWVEKYRPRTVEECILPKEMKKTFQEIVNSGDVLNMLFTGTSGLGKTTVAKAICNELDIDYMMVNGSNEGRLIETLRQPITKFASTVSISGGRKVVILDEADYLNPQTVQPALRNFIEEFSNNCSFILTCNYKHKLIPAIHSRCGVYEFNVTNKDLATLSAQFMKRLQFILNTEGIEYQDQVIAEMIMKYAPDWRRVINECQRYSKNGAIDTGILVNINKDGINQLLKFMKDKNLKSVRQWVTDNIHTETQAIYRQIYDEISEHMTPISLATTIITMADYQYKDAFVADHEINLVAFLYDVMGFAEWKK